MPSPRYTPYHVPHRIEIAGFMTILHGDMRFYNNVFVQPQVHPFMLQMADMLKGNDWDNGNAKVGTWVFDDYPTQAERKREFDGYCGMGCEVSDRYYMHLPV